MGKRANYGFEKRQKEIKRQQKKQAKEEKKRMKKESALGGDQADVIDVNDGSAEPVDPDRTYHSG